MPQAKPDFSLFCKISRKRNTTKGGKIVTHRWKRSLHKSHLKILYFMRGVIMSHKNAEIRFFKGFQILQPKHI